MMKTNVLSLALILAIGIPSTASAADKETRQMMADIRMLQEQAQQLQNLMASLNQALKETIANAVQSVNAKVDAKTEDQSNLTRKAFADQNLVVNAISIDLRALKEKVDDNSVRVGTLRQEIDALREIVTQMHSGRAAAADPALGPPDGTPEPTGASALGMSPDQLWQTAYADYASGQYDLAVTGFQTYISTFPKSEKAVDAQVTICNAYVNGAKYDNAVQACDTAIRNYPSSERLSEAYYRKGQAHQSLKQNDRAREAYETVVKRFPDSNEATLARQRLLDVTKK
jgi:tol-pal system protein YbgF